MKKKVLVPLLGSVVLSLGAYVGYHTYDAYAGTNENDMLLENVEALAWGESISNWWNSKVYKCVEDACSVTYINVTFYGKYEKCLNGTEKAHCYECKSCDAIMAG